MSSKNIYTKWILAGIMLSSIATLTVNAELCTKNICEYEFVVRESRSMMYAVEYPSGWQDVYDVALNGSQLTLKENSGHPTVPDDVYHDEILRKTNTLDGIPAHMIVINDRFVGPTIEVMEGAHVVVKVINNLQKESMTLHWHGMHQRSTFYMDGVPYFTQCPINPGQSFTYQFIADPAGTHWYHSHLSNQRADGLYGVVIIHRERPSLPYFELAVSDWFHAMSTQMETLNPFKTYDRGSGSFHLQTIDRDHSFDGVKLSTLGYVSGLINGRGRYNGNQAPLTKFQVTKGLTYRFHVIGATNEFAYQLSIDHHKLKVIEMDGFLVNPVEVQSFIVVGGETYVFEVKANQVDNTSYWMRAKTLKDGKGPFIQNDGTSKDQILAIFTYSQGKDALKDPETLPKNCTLSAPCYVLNCFWKDYPQSVYPNTKCIPIDHMRLSSSPAMENMDKSFLSPTEDVHEIFLNFAFSAGSSINNHRFIFPKSSPIYDSASTHLKPCSAECLDDGCKCTNVVKLPLNKTIQLVLMSFTTVNDMGKNYSSKAHHPIHLHGHSFYVLKQGFGVVDKQTKRIIGLNEDIVCDNKPCSRQHWKRNMTSEFNFKNPPLKDTVVAPAQGYTVIRFRSDNPGFWLFHCHTLFHSVEGMKLVFDETTFEGSNTTHLKQPPPSFPKCKSFERMNNDMFNQWKDGGGRDESEGEESQRKQCDGGFNLLITCLVVLLVVAILVIFVLAMVLVKGKNNKNKIMSHKNNTDTLFLKEK